MHIGSWPNSSSQRLNQERETHSYCEASLYEHQRKERRFLRAPFPLPPLSTLLPSPPPPSLIQFRPLLTISGFYLIVFLLPSQLRVDKAERMSMIHVIVLKTAFKDGTAETSEEVGQFELRYA
ncbi:hypothetical protein HZH66_000712 [Vespula vulgaris]|uniref:Uncharacterized protein n=1 Tax=Vespula vulgaris TaxID=7454 RepID=A0A834KRN4_VESVU|nr:hypothetical protein HZH66_000712 [Vespula vulgaris]